MPTGYTALIQEGISFQDFVLQCSRAFGALIMMRDEPMGAPIPEQFQPSEYNKKQLSKIQKELDVVKAMTPEQAESAAAAEFSEWMDQYQKNIAEVKALKFKYETMLELVKAWEPPTNDHFGLKTFMIQQLEQTIEFDCDLDCYTAPVKKTGEAWHAERISQLEKGIALHAKEQQKENELTETRNKWLADLRGSLSVSTDKTKAH